MTMLGEPGRVLVARGGAIGDFILTLPVLAALRTRFPDAPVEVLGYPHIAGLAVAGGLADAVHPIESAKFAPLFVADAAISDSVARLFRGVDLVISYLHDPSRAFERNVRTISGAAFLRGSHRPDEARKRHATDILLEPLSALGVVEPDPVPRLRIPTEPATAPDGRGAPVLVVHPGSGSERKNWPEASWGRLLDGLWSQTDCRLLLVGGEAEGERLDRLARHWPAERLELARHWPLVELARRLQGTTAFVGHDSGITHLAAALGRPVLVLWGETPQVVWRPRGEQVRLLRHRAGLARLRVETVRDHCKAALSGCADRRERQRGTAETEDLSHEPGRKGRARTPLRVATRLRCMEEAAGRGRDHAADHANRQPPESRVYAVSTRQVHGKQS